MLVHYLGEDSPEDSDTQANFFSDEPFSLSLDERKEPEPGGQMCLDDVEMPLFFEPVE